MARKNRCTLCGGKVSPSGICMECGWDNTKNDEKYHLNAHNEDGMKLHSGDCEDMLNRENPRKRARKEQLWMAREASAGDSRTKSGAGTTPRKKHRLLRWIVILFVVFELFGNAFFDLFADALDALGDATYEMRYEIRYALEELGFLEEDYADEGSWSDEDIRSVNEDLEEAVEAAGDPYWDSSDSEERPERRAWDEDFEGYVSMELPQGYYYVGYEIPVGVYQLECLTDTAWVSVYRTDEAGYYDYWLLYSEEEQAAYPDYMEGEECPWYELSPVISLEESMVLVVEGMSSMVWLTGEGEGMDSLVEHEEQNLGNWLLEEEETLTVGQGGFEAGAYDVVAYGDNPVAYVEIEAEDGYYSEILLGGEWVEFLRFPFAEGDTITVTLYSDDTEVWLLPSW
ncbi:MAG: hypothetical protein LUF27_01630 [Lachnospiraceae bacterium]|nr:hypothetical protein [Lachnospiraceae bacterium]